MAEDTSHAFLRTLADHLSVDKQFIARVAEHVAGRLLGGQAVTGAPAAVAAAAAPKPRGRRKKGAAAPAAPAKASASKKVPRGGAVERVLSAIRGGASKRADVLAKSGVTTAGYSYAVKVLKSKGLVKVHGTRGQATVTAT